MEFSSPPLGQVSSTKKTAAINPETFNKLRQEADQAREKGDLAEAVRLYNQLVKMRPGWAEGWWYLGSIHYDSDQYAAAASALEKCVAHDAQNPQAWGLLGLCEYRLARNANALEHLTKSRQLGLDRIPEISRVVRLHQAMLLNRSRQYEAAHAVLKTFAVEHQEANSVLDAMGMAVLRIPNLIDTLSPEQREMVRQFGKAAYLEAEQKRSESFKLYEQLEAQYHGRPNVAYAFGSALLLQREPEKAIDFFKQELAREPNHDAALVQIALQLMAMRKFEVGIEYAQKAILAAPGNFAGYYVLGRTYLYMDNLPHSIPMLEKAATIAPTVATLHYTLSQAYQRAGRSADTARARTRFEKLEAMNKDQRGDLFIAPDDFSSSSNSATGSAKQP